MTKKALITGITGQDGSYLAELLLEKDYQVYGLVRTEVIENQGRIEHLRDKLKLFKGDITDQAVLDRVVGEVGPDEVYNLAAQSFIPTSWEKPVLTGNANGIGAVMLLDSIRRLKPDVKFYQASSSEMFGNASESPQSELTAFNPRTPYGSAKVYAYHVMANYREKYGMFASSGILFNHESPRRGLELVTRKITHSVASIKLGLSTELYLGSLDTKRDWGFAGDYVRAMWLMLQQPAPDDFVISTGTTHSVGEFVEKAFSSAGLDWSQYVKIDPRFVRPPEKVQLVGNPAKAREVLNWQPAVGFDELIEMMVQADLKALSTEEV